MVSIPFEKANGHILAVLGERKALIDTGSPFSLAMQPFDFLGIQHPASSEFQKDILRKIKEVAGFQFDLLIGCDILAQQDLRICWCDGVLIFGTELTDGPILLQLKKVAGVPVFPLRLKEHNINAIFDTGAPLSYVDPALVAGSVSLGQREDFYPGIGRFSATIYRVPVCLDTDPVILEFGILPDEFQPALSLIFQQTSCSAVVGTGLLETFDCNISWARNTISWSRR